MAPEKKPYRDAYGRTKVSDYKQYARPWYREVYRNLPVNLRTDYPVSGSVKSLEENRVLFNQRFPTRTFEDILWEALPEETAPFKKLGKGDMSSPVQDLPPMRKRGESSSGKHSHPKRKRGESSSAKESHPKRKRGEDDGEKQPQNKKPKLIDEGSDSYDESSDGDDNIEGFGMYPKSIRRQKKKSERHPGKTQTLTYRTRESKWSQENIPDSFLTSFELLDREYQKAEEARAKARAEAPEAQDSIIGESEQA